MFCKRTHLSFKGQWREQLNEKFRAKPKPSAPGKVLEKNKPALKTFCDLKSLNLHKCSHNNGAHKHFLRSNK